MQDEFSINKSMLLCFFLELFIGSVGLYHFEFVCCGFFCFQFEFVLFGKVASNTT